jgi:GNAT superfamily N-acetyltransferase
MTRPRIRTSDDITPELEGVLEAGLDAFNMAAAGYGDARPIAVVAEDPETGEVIGGATGRTSLGLLFLDLFYLPESHRVSGLGSEILEAFEVEGRARGCRSAVLYTISFQAPDFYERRGWTRFGEVPCDPPGTSRVFMSKALRPSA